VACAAGQWRKRSAQHMAEDKEVLNEKLEGLEESEVVVLEVEIVAGLIYHITIIFFCII